MMSCSIFGSNAVALATAMAALSGTVIFLAFCRENTQILGADDSPPRNQTPRSCLSSSDGKKEKKNKKKKRVRFAESVREARRNGDDYRGGRREWVERSCRDELIREGMPANRGALYSSMMRDRMNRMEWSSSCC